MSDEAGFLSRWARRKQAALRGAPPEVLDAPELRRDAETPPPLGGPDGVAPSTGLAAEAPVSLPAPAEPSSLAAAPGRLDPMPESEPFDVSSLPPVDLLDAASDFTAFLRPGVPAALRSAALRKAWTADPLIRDYLSPLDYGWDFNAPGGLPFGFSDTLGEGADKVLQLIRQAVGEPEPPPEEGAPPAEPAPAAIPLEELPPSEALVAETTPSATPEMEAEQAEPPRRRHGGALPT